MELLSLSFFHKKKNVVKSALNIKFITFYQILKNVHFQVYSSVMLRLLTFLHNGTPERFYLAKLQLCSY